MIQWLLPKSRSYLYRCGEANVEVYRQVMSYKFRFLQTRNSMNIIVKKKSVFMWQCKIEYVAHTLMNRFLGLDELYS